MAIPSKDGDLIEDAIQLFFDKCGERAISIESGIEKLQWAIITGGLSPQMTMNWRIG